MKSPIKWIGGKTKYAPKLVQLFPIHKGFVECFGGSLVVLFEKPILKGGCKMKRKDIFFTFILGLAGFGLSHFYIGDKKRGIILLFSHFILAVSIAFSMFKSSVVPQVLYFIYIGLIVWGEYDSIKTAKLINEYLK